MAKDKKNKNVVEVEEILEKKKLSKKEENKSKYPNIKGDHRDFIVKILNRVEKAPRSDSTFKSIIQVVTDKRKEVATDVELSTLEKELNKFATGKDFKNYDIKFYEEYLKERL